MKKQTTTATPTSKKKVEDKVLIPGDTLNNVLSEVDAILEQLLEVSGDVALSEAERRRLQGSGVRRYGFIEKTADIARDNLEFAPPFLDVDALRDVITQIEIIRNINASLQQLTRLNGDLLLLTSDEAFRLALMYYNSVRDASRRRVPGAEALFRILQQFFRRPGRTSDKPTEKEIERDVKGLLKGTKEGEIIIKNERPKTVGGKRTIVDEVHKGKLAVKKVSEGEIEE
jgi:hypothetical protein